MLMSYYSDLTPYEYSQSNADRRLLNVGWLDRSHPYQTGSVSAEVLRATLKLCENPVRQTRGFHVCEFCERPAFGVIVTTSDKEITLGSAEIRVARNDNIDYAGP